MRTARFWVTGRDLLAMGVLAVSFGFVGCGSGEQPAEEGTNLSTQSASELPTASIATPENEAVAPELPKDSPEWALREIQLERLKHPETEDVAAIRTFQRERNYRILELATHAIAKTHENPAQNELFESFVHHALEAQLQLAIQTTGVAEEEHKQNVNELYQNAELLLKRDAKSAAAQEGAFTLVKFAEIMARKFASENPVWLEEYARQARLYAQNFPEDDARAIAKLDGAGWSCESHRQTELATACYTQIQEQFANNPLAQHIPAVLRRLNLKGQELKLAGPTSDGQFFSIDSLRSKVVLVAFWAADTEDFELDAAILRDVYSKSAAAGFEIVGVNLDENEARMQAFLKQQNFTWPNIFYIDQAKRRWNNPLVSYYGVREIPTYWLVNQNGEVVDFQVSLQTVEEQVQQLLGK